MIPRENLDSCEREILEKHLFKITFMTVGTRLALLDFSFFDFSII